ncbi:MAG: IS21 family transposase [Ignavibacteriales bacterium]|nr:IS21 family transposase [Ignavibacteriales bacterium]
MDKHTIIRLKKQGHSNRAIGRLTGIDRKTVARYWNEFTVQTELLHLSESNVKAIQAAIVSEPCYDTSSRTSRKYNDEMDKKLDEILSQEEKKNLILGSHKQNLTKLQIHQELINDGFDISYSTIAVKINQKRDKSKECFIKQTYELGCRLEYDFGEVKLLIDGKLDKYYIAVISSPAADFRWAFLYKNEKKDVFMDSHIRFFEMVGGVYKEVVYDNMRNVVAKFIGRNEKTLNEDLIKMSIYYGFEINVTNCFSGNEKGHVEGSVKIIRNHIFATNYEFTTFEDAQTYLHSQLLKMNESSNINAEKECLLPYKPKLELANISSNDVNKYSFIRVDNNFYSVPDYLIGKEVSVKSYYDKIMVYAHNIFVCEHKKIDGFDGISIDIRHYLKSFLKKPGAIKNSLALKSIPYLKSIFDKHFSTNPKKFIEIIAKNKENDLKEIVKIFDDYTKAYSNSVPIDNIPAKKDIYQAAKSQMARYDELCIRKAVQNAN